MKTIMKTLFVVLTSFALLSSAQAGEMSVSGSAKASWSNVSGVQSGKQIGIANELLFSATGELDNGYTWTYSVALDPTNVGDTATTPTATVPGAAINDDQTLALGMPGLGTAAINVSAGGFNAKYGWNSDAYYIKSDSGKNEGISYPGDLGSYSNVTFTTEAGLLPLGAVIQAGYGYAKADGDSLNVAGKAGADTAQNFGLTLKPIDGLTVGATYIDYNSYSDGGKHSQDAQGGAYYAKYAFGNVTVGYGKSYNAPEVTVTESTAGGTTKEYYENTGISIGYALNDQVRLSYTDENSEAHYLTSSTVNYDVGVRSFQIAYNIGGATLSLARSDVDNASYVNNSDFTETVIGLAMAF